MSLDDVIVDAVKMGLTSREVNTLKEQYYFGLQRYEDMVPRNSVKPGILAMLQYENSRMLCGEAYARKYMRNIIDKAQKGETK